MRVLNVYLQLQYCDGFGDIAYLKCFALIKNRRIKIKIKQENVIVPNTNVCVLPMTFYIKINY